MPLNTWSAFRHAIYDDCFLRAKDALFNTVDALMTETQAKSLPEVTQSLWFERKWSSIYEAGDRWSDRSARAATGIRAIFARRVPGALAVDRD